MDIHCAPTQLKQDGGELWGPEAKLFTTAASQDMASMIVATATSPIAFFTELE